MILLDSNILIYAAKPDGGELRSWIGGMQPAPAVSVVSCVEVLGFHRFAPGEREVLEDMFSSALVLPLDDEVVTQAVRLRQARNMGLGDAIVAATALVHRRTLVTRNTRDFDHIDGLTLHNPFPAG